jgi:hypothetical protein
MEDIIDIIVTETTNLIEITSQPTDEVIDVNIIDNREDITLNVTPSVVEININQLTGNFGILWGEIEGTLSNQADLQNALNLKADLVDGKVPSSQLPSYVDDVVEVANYAALPATGEVGKIYITLDTNFIYRWTGSTYVEIKDSSAVWGAITGTLSSQTDLQSALNAKANDNAVVHLLGSETITGAKTLTGGLTLGTSSGDNQTLLNLPATNQLIYREGVGSLYGFNIESGVDNSLFLTNSEGGFFQTLYFGDSQGSYNIFGISTKSGASDWSAKFVINQNGHIGLNKNNPTEILDVAGNGLFSGSLTANTIVKSGGASSQFLKADGSVDSSTYALDSAVVKLTGAQTIAGVKTFSNRIVVDIDTTTNNAAFFKNVSTNGYGVSIQGGVGTNYALYVSNNVGSKVFEVLGNGATSIIGSLAVTGTGSFTGALSGTSATFSGDINTGTIANEGSNYVRGSFNGVNTSANLSAVYFSGGDGSQNRAGLKVYQTWGGTYTDTCVDLFVTKGGVGGTTALSINGLGAATFSSSVTATIGYFGSSTTIGFGGVKLFVKSSTALDYEGLVVQSSSNSDSVTIAHTGTLGRIATTYGTGGTGTFTDLAFATSGTDRLYITSAGNVGIGTTSPLQTATNRTVVTVNGTSQAILNFGISGTLSGYIYSDVNNYTELYSVGQLALLANASQPMTFNTQGSERMRITSGGNVLIGTTSTTGNATGSASNNGTVIEASGTITNQRNDNVNIYLSKASGFTEGNLIVFYTQGSLRGSISTNGVITSYNTTSDYRLKEDLKPINGLEIVNKIKVYDYKWKASDSRMDGVLAHELAEVLPYAVNGVKDGEQMQGVDYSKIVPVLIQSIKELKSKIETLENK